MSADSTCSEKTDGIQDILQVVPDPGVSSFLHQSAQQAISVAGCSVQVASGFRRSISHAVVCYGETGERREDAAMQTLGTKVAKEEIGGSRARAVDAKKVFDGFPIRMSRDVCRQEPFGNQLALLGRSVPWEMAEIHREAIESALSMTIEEAAYAGGLSPEELCIVLRGPYTTRDAASHWLADKIDEFEERKRMPSSQQTLVGAVIDGSKPLRELSHEVSRQLGDGNGMAAVGMEIGLTDDEIELWVDRTETLDALIFNRLLEQHKEKITAFARLNDRHSQMRTRLKGLLEEDAAKAKSS